MEQKILQVGIDQLVSRARLPSYVRDRLLAQPVPKAVVVVRDRQEPKDEHDRRVMAMRRARLIRQREKLR